MNKLTRKFISVFFLAVILLVSGPAQLIHAAFHNHAYTAQANKNSTTVSTAHTYCTALQLTLPEFFKAGVPVFQNISLLKNHFFAEVESAIPHISSFRNCGRAPPVLA